MRKKLIIVIILLIILIISGCNKYEEVDYKKPYLTLDNNLFNKLKLKMYDYETKESVDVKTYGFGEYIDGIYNENNNDYIIAAPRTCHLLVVHSNSNSEIFNPCILTKTTDASIGDFALNSKYLIVSLNIGVEEEGEDYKYVIAVFDNDYQLVDYFSVPGEVRAVNIFDDKIMYSYKDSFWDDENFGKIGNYNLKTKENIIKNDDTLYKEFFLKINNNFYAINGGVSNECKIYLNGKQISSNPEIEYYCYRESVYNYQVNNDIIVPINEAFAHEFGFIKIDKNKPKKISYIKDDVCSGFDWFTSQGKYCKDKEKKNIYFNDFKNGPKKLDIDIESGWQFAFFKW